MYCIYVCMHACVYLIRPVEYYFFHVNKRYICLLLVRIYRAFCCGWQGSCGDRANSVEPECRHGGEKCGKSQPGGMVTVYGMVRHGMYSMMDPLLCCRPPPMGS
jgi:hypothetical protein